jgi:hypothetical protein
MVWHEMKGIRSKRCFGADRYLPVVVQLVVRDIIICMGAGPVVVVLKVVDRGFEQVNQSEGAQ